MIIIPQVAPDGLPDSTLHVVGNRFVLTSSCLGNSVVSYSS